MPKEQDASSKAKGVRFDLQAIQERRRSSFLCDAEEEDDDSMYVCLSTREHYTAQECKDDGDNVKSYVDPPGRRLSKEAAGMSSDSLPSLTICRPCS